MSSPNKKGSDLVAFWYKPHYQCGWDGTTPQEAADFINQQMDIDGLVAADFVGISEWTSNITIGNPSEYGVIGSVCGYAITDYTSSVALFYKKKSWELQESYPKSSQCNTIPVPPWEGPHIGKVCVDQVTPDDENCCSCTYSKEEYKFGDDLELNLGQRPWVAGIFKNKANVNERKVCVVSGEVPHPLSNTTFDNLNGILTSDPKPYSIQKYLCTLDDTHRCVRNLTNSSILFGTDVLISEVTKFCGDIPIIFMADTNAAMGYVTTGSMFLDKPLSLLQDATPLSPYTCCNDTFYGGGLNSYASDRIGVSGDELMIDLLEGGSTAPQGPLVGDMTYYCHSPEEHVPLRAYISFKFPYFY